MANERAAASAADSQYIQDIDREAAVLASSARIRIIFVSVVSEPLAATVQALSQSKTLPLVAMLGPGGIMTRPVINVPVAVEDDHVTAPIDALV